jgi:hypothetical protein
MKWNLIVNYWEQLVANFTNPLVELPDDHLEMIKIRMDQRAYKTRERHEIAMTVSGEEPSRWQGMQRVQDSVIKK